MNMQIVTSLLVVLVTCSRAATNQTLVYSWVRVEYDWPNETMKQEYITSKKYIVENNIITGIKVYKDDVFITVPRWKAGVPSTLNKVVMRAGGPVLQPFPSWGWQAVGDCGSLQYVQSMELDPNTGLMWIIDNGRINIMDNVSSNVCPPKLVIYDINLMKTVKSYTFPDDVANHTSCFLNDIVLDYVNGVARYAYVTDTRDAKLYVYDVIENTAYFFQDDTMKATIESGSVPIDGIAVSADFQYVYYCPIDGYGLFQVPTSVLRNKNARFKDHVRNVGRRQSRSDGLAYGQRSLFYGLLDASGVERWFVEDDAKSTGYDNVLLTSHVTLAQDDVRMRWADTFAWDESGHLWFTANDLTRYFPGAMNFSEGAEPNMYVWKVFVNERSYLNDAVGKTASRASRCLDNAGVGAALIMLVAHFLSRGF